MRRDKAWRTANGINIPCGANIQACPVRRDQASVHNVTTAMRRLLRFHDFIFARQPHQRVGQFRPFGDGEAEAEKEPRLAAAGGMRRIWDGIPLGFGWAARRVRRDAAAAGVVFS